jgi:outer membrane lipoprotein-sorting protein
MRWGLPGRRGPGDSGSAELDARLSGAWDAAATAAGKILDLPAGKAALLANLELSQEEIPDLRPDTGRTWRVAWRRHRRLTLCSIAGAAVAAAVALAAVVVPGAGQGRLREPVVDTAYVVQRVSSALSAGDSAEIAQTTVTTRVTGVFSGTTTTRIGQVWSYGDQWRMVTNPSAGQPRYDEGSTSTAVYTLVNYQARTWARQAGQDHPPAPLIPLITRLPDGCVPVFGPVPVRQLQGIGLATMSQSASVARALRGAVSCGTLTLAGRQRVGGIETIKLTSRPDRPFSETIWVDPDTYLPVRVSTRLAPGGPGTPQVRRALEQTADITWIRPSAQNLAKLTVPIPPGFRKVPLAQAVGPTLRPIP